MQFKPVPADRRRLMLVGSYPPPFGGCSVHVERLHRALVAEYDIDVVDLYGEPSGEGETWLTRCGSSRPASALRAFRALRTSRASIVHFHVAGMDAFLMAGYPMLAILPRGTRKVITIHSGSFVARFKQGPAWRRVMLRALLRCFDRIITVSEAQRMFLRTLGIPAEKMSVVPAFLPPVAVESPRVRAIFDSLRSYSRLFISSGYGERHYGFHTILDALELIEPPPDDTALIFCTYNSFDEDYMTDISARLSTRRSAALVRDLAPTEFAWLLERCDVYIRATDRDGDAVAVREAAFFGKAVVASDCAIRPAGAVLFRTGDAKSLAVALSDVSGERRNGRRDKALDTLGELRSVYASVSS